MIFQYGYPLGNIEVIYSIVDYDLPIFYFGRNIDTNELCIIYQYDVNEEMEYEEFLFMNSSEKQYFDFLSGKVSTLNLVLESENIMFVKDNYEDLVIKNVTIGDLDKSKLPDRGYYLIDNKLSLFKEDSLSIIYNQSKVSSKYIQSSSRVTRSSAYEIFENVIFEDALAIQSLINPRKDEQDEWSSEKYKLVPCT